MIVSHGEHVEFQGPCGRYVGLVLLGEGSSAWVFDAIDPVVGRKVAIKVFKPGIDEDRIAHELRLLAAAEGPGVPTMIEWGRTRDQAAYLVMSSIRGGRPLSGVLTDGWGVARNLCRVVARLHRLGIVHRDIKPANVLIDRRDEVWLLDFGLAKRVDDVEAGTAPGECLGTPGFRAPEQEGGAIDADARADVYALGRTLSVLRVRRGARAWSRMLRRAMSQSPHDRPADAAALLAMLVDPWWRRFSRGWAFAMFLIVGLSWIGMRAPMRASTAFDLPAVCLDTAAEMIRAEGDGASVLDLVGELSRSADQILDARERAEFRLRCARVLESADQIDRASGLVILAQRDAAMTDDESLVRLAAARLGRLQHHAGELASARTNLFRAVRDLDPARASRQELEAALWLSAVAADQGSWQEAESWIAWAEQGAAEPPGWIEEHAAFSRGYVAELRQHHADAIEEYERALRHRRRRVGPTDLAIAEVTSRLGTLHSLAGNPERASLLLRESVEIRSDAKAARPTLIAQSQSALAAHLHRLGEASEAADLFMASAASYEAVLGEEHEYVGTSLSNASAALVLSGRLQEAIVLAGRAHKILTASLGRGHWQTVNTKRILAEALGRSGDLASACELLAEVSSSLPHAEAPAAVIEKAARFMAEFGCPQSRDESGIDEELSERAVGVR